MTTKQAAKHFGVSRSTIYRWIRKGRLSAHKVGRSWVISVPREAKEDSMDIAEKVRAWNRESDRYTQDRIFDELLNYAREHYPVKGASIREDFNSNLIVDVDMPNAPVEVHLSKNEDTLALDHVKIEVERVTSLPVYEMGVREPIRHDKTESSFTLLTLKSVDEQTGEEVMRSIVRPGHSFWKSLPYSNTVDMRVRAQANFRMCFADGGAGGEYKPTDWCEWSEWVTIGSIR